VQAVRDQLDISERQACRYVQANRRMVRYIRIPKDDGPLRARLEELAWSCAVSVCDGLLC
jgi:hypothetical protein